MRAPIAEAPTPLALASSANCLFHSSKPALELPHCAADASLVNQDIVIHESATATPTVNRLGLIILISLHTLRQTTGWSTDPTNMRQAASTADMQRLMVGVGSVLSHIIRLWACGTSLAIRHPRCIDASPSSLRRFQVATEPRVLRKAVLI